MMEETVTHVNVTIQQGQAGITVKNVNVVM